MRIQFHQIQELVYTGNMPSLFFTQEKFVKKIMLLALCLLSAQLSSQELVNRISSVKPSVVAIAILNPTASPRLALVGTGFVVGDGTQIATNAHVVGKILDDAKNEQYVVLSGQGNTPKIHLITAKTLDTKN